MIFWKSITDLAKSLSNKYVCWAMGHQLDSPTYHSRMELNCRRCGWSSIK